MCIHQIYRLYGGGVTIIITRIKRTLACARLSDSIRSENVLKAKLRRARLGKGRGNGGKNGRESLLAFL